VDDVEIVEVDSPCLLPLRVFKREARAWKSREFSESGSELSVKRVVASLAVVADLELHGQIHIAIAQLLHLHLVRTEDWMNRCWYIGRLEYPHEVPLGHSRIDFT
jgi:hypothetical protein